MMRKNVLALSIAAMIGGLGFAGAASAAAPVAGTATELRVNASGTGHSLIVPYFTAQNGNMTVFHIVNTDTVQGKAVKVRFRGASNSDDLLDFQVLMSPGDVWTAAVSRNAAGVAQLITADKTCTVPATVATAAQPFATNRLNPALSGDALNTQTREGYIEIFNMADIDSSAAYNATMTAAGGAVQSTLFTAIKHVNGVAPCTAAAIGRTANYTTPGVGGGLDTNVSGLINPTTGLVGSWYILNAATTTAFSGAANAITATTAAGVASTGNIVFSPQLASNLVTGAGSITTADPLIVSGLLTALQNDVPDLSTPYVGGGGNAAAQATALTATLAKNTIINQYATDSTIAAQTDWVFSMPTRRYSIAANYAAAAQSGSSNNVATVTQAGVVTGTTSNSFRIINSDVNSYFLTPANTSVDTGRICATASSQSFFDREETTGSSVFVVSPGTAATLSLCGEVSLASFGGSVLGASVATSSLTGSYVNGWGSVNFGGLGVPVLGAAFQKFANTSTGGSGNINYGVTWPHAFK